MRCPRLAPFCVALALLDLHGPAHAAPPALSPERAAAAAITPAALRARVRFLSDDQFAGRGPGSQGDALARAYMASEFEALGLLPAGEPEGGKPGFLQWVQLVGLRSHLLAPPEFRATTKTLPVSVSVPQSDVVMVSGEQTATSEVVGAELVFVGYGITAPEYQWDDYKGVDLRGKVLLMMNNDPESDPKLFAGRTRLYYGRWDYKYKEAARHGAAGAILIHTTPSAGYPWQVVRASWSGEDFEAPEPAGERAQRLKIRGWLTEEASKRVALAGGHDLDALRRAAEARTFRPVPLGVKVSMRVKTDVRRLRSANVLAVLPGSDPRLRGESVVFTAHLDHLGTRQDLPGADKIYNGALDNATGLAGLLSIARAATLGPSPRRSLVFCAVAAEEAGLVGSEYLVKHPPQAVGTPIANLNIDGLNIYGRSPHVVQIGRGKSSLDAVVDAVAAAQGRKVMPDQMPEKGSFYRSDQFNFARGRIPAIYLGQPVDLIGPDGKVVAGAGRVRVERFIQENYHRPTDELREDWSFEGAVQDVQLLYLAGLRVAAAPGRPRYDPRDEFANMPW